MNRILLHFSRYCFSALILMSLLGCTLSQRSESERTLTPAPGQDTLLTQTQPVETPTTEVVPIQKPITPEQQFVEYLKTEDAQKTIEEFTNAYQLDAETAKLVRNGLTTKEITGKDGKTYTIAFASVPEDKIPPEDKKYADLYSNIPLMIAEKGEYGEWGWKKANLKQGGEAVGISMGVLIDPRFYAMSKQWENQYSLAAVTLGPEHILSPDSYDFSWTSSQIYEASKNNLPTRLYHIIFPGSAPEWLKQNPTQENLNIVVEKVMDFAVKSNINEIIVVNEANGAPYREDPFYEKLGIDYIIQAFQVARERAKDSNIKLGYNDSNNHSSSGLTTKFTQKVVNTLREKNLIDFVGLQMHLRGISAPNKQDIITTMKGYGIPVRVTEFDIDMTDVPENQINKEQAQIAKIAVESCIESKVCENITIWGANDSYSWLGEKSRSTFIDTNNNPKMSYIVTLKTLFEHFASENSAYNKPSSINAEVQPTLPIIATMTPTKEPQTPQKQFAEYLKTEDAQKTIEEFTNAYQLDAETAELVKTGLTTKEITGKGGKTYMIASATLPSYNESYPLLIAEKNENGEWEWKGYSLRKLFEENQISNGTEFTGWWIDDPRWQEIVGKQFNLATIDYGIYWNEIEPTQGNFVFDIPERQIKLAEQKEMQIRGMGLVYPPLYPDWLVINKGSADDFKQILESHVSSIVTHFKGKVDQWTVVTEPYINPYRTNDILYKKLGYDYIEIAFRAARTADPSAILIYEDTFNHSSNGITTSLTHKIVENLKNKGLIDRVGLEMHIDASKPLDVKDIIKTMRSYNLPVSMTSVDVDISKIKGTPQERITHQAEIFGKLVKACLDSEVCTDFSVWGIGDKHHWLDLQNPDADPTLFDDNLKPKQAFWAIMQTLLNNINP